MNAHGLFLLQTFFFTYLIYSQKFWRNRIFFIYLSHFQLIKYIALKRTKLGNPSRSFSEESSTFAGVNKIITFKNSIDYEKK